MAVTTPFGSYPYGRGSAHSPKRCARASFRQIRPATPVRVPRCREQSSPLARGVFAIGQRSTCERLTQDVWLRPVGA
jgi:hypothetical protein